MQKDSWSCLSCATKTREHFNSCESRYSHEFVSNNLDRDSSEHNICSNIFQFSNGISQRKSLLHYQKHIWFKHKKIVHRKLQNCRWFLVDYKNFLNPKYIDPQELLVILNYVNPAMQYTTEINDNKLPQYSPFDACDRTHIRATSLMRVKNSMHYFCLWHLFSGTLERRK